MAKKNRPKTAASGGDTPAERARQRSAELRADAAKRSKRQAAMVQIGVVVAVVAVVIVATVAVLSARNDSAAVSGPPANVTSDGAFRIGPADADVTIQAVEDFQCPACKAFEESTGDLLSSYADGGKVAVEYRGIAFLDSQSSTEYSSRALNASACVLDTAPGKWRDFHDAMFVAQPEEGGSGLPDDELISIAEDSGVERSAVAGCIRNGKFRSWAEDTTKASAKDGVTGTPTIFVNGKKLQDSSAAAIQAAVEKAQGS